MYIEASTQQCNDVAEAMLPNAMFHLLAHRTVAGNNSAQSRKLGRDPRANVDENKRTLFPRESKDSRDQRRRIRNAQLASQLTRAGRARLFLRRDGVRNIPNPA